MITNKRLLVKSGVAKEEVWFTDLCRIKDSIVKTGLSDKILGTGKIYPITPEYPYAPKMHAYTEGGMYRLKKVYNIVEDREGEEEEVSEIELFRKSQTHPHLKGLKEPYALHELLEGAIFKKKQTS